MIKAVILADSLAPTGERLTTMELTYPRWILPEVLTHKLFSRCGESSRAIPAMVKVRQVLHDPAMPVFWGKNQPGMQAEEELPTVRKYACIALWHFLRYVTVVVSFLLHKIGLHKQLANRPLELWVWYKQIVSSTEWDNFFKQRLHPAAQPEMQALAYEMHYALGQSQPRNLDWNEWHTPLVTPAIPDSGSYAHMVSVGRCAAVSYGNHHKENWDKDYGRALRMLSENPAHMSPFEHVAIPGFGTRNFKGWVQLREVLEDEGKERPMQ